MSATIPPSENFTKYSVDVLKDYHSSLDSSYLQPRGEKVPLDNKPICIIGAGCAGLFAARILDQLQKQFPKLSFKYEILEASHRVGGRLHTYKFPEGGEYDYYDLGAMRFPKTAYMDSTFNLFDKLKLKTIPYNFSSGNTFLHYNGYRFQRDEAGNPPVPWRDDFKLRDDIPWYFICLGVKEIGRITLSDFVQPFAGGRTQFPAAWANLMGKGDTYSTRSYLTAVWHIPGKVIDWLETFDKSTGWYDRALSETVLETLAFDYPTSGEETVEPLQRQANETPKEFDERWEGFWKSKAVEYFMKKQSTGSAPNPNPSNATGIDWFCIDGGSSNIAKAMAASIKEADLHFHERVTRIDLGAEKDTESATEKGIEGFLRVTSQNTNGRRSEHRAYSHVISSIPLPCLRTVDLSGCKLKWPVTSALRMLQYGPSIKIGIMFKSTWWYDKFKIIGGQSYTDLPVRTVVYPSYPPETDRKSRVLIVSYCWTEDALRLGSMINHYGSKEEQALIDLVMRDLAAIHGVDLKYLWDQYLDYYAYDWYDNDLTMGAFAFFAPGQFSDIYPHVTQPAAKGRLHFIGEATSTNHAWVAGALDSAYRGVYEIVHLSYPPEVEQWFKDNIKPLTDEWDDLELLEQHINVAMNLALRPEAKGPISMPSEIKAAPSQ